MFRKSRWEKLQKQSHCERREQSPERCAKDPDWIAGRAKSEEGGPLVSSISNSILMPTKYSELK